MTYGVFTSDTLEIAQTKHWALCLYCNDDKTVIGAKLYNGTDEDKALAGICERDLNNNLTFYAYEDLQGVVHSNNEIYSSYIGTSFDYNISGMKQIDEIELSEPYEMPTVTEVGIERCLKMWRMGVNFRIFDGGMQFIMVTNKIEYVFIIREEDTDIYCGASVNIPYADGMFGSGQYFRLRNFADNSQPFCRFHSDLGGDAVVCDVPKMECISGQCNVTDKGLYWPLKSYTDDVIILCGCGGDEYKYVRTPQRSEYFKIRD